MLDTDDLSLSPSNPPNTHPECLSNSTPKFLSPRLSIRGSLPDKIKMMCYTKS